MRSMFGMKFTKKEIEDLSISVLAIAFIVAIVYSKILGIGIASAEFLMLFFVALITVGSGFIFHELAHKYVAIKYRCYAEFRAWETGLAIAILLAVFLNFIFIAPGAVYISSFYLTKKENAYISLAGSVANLILAFAFLAVAVFFPFPSLRMLGRIGADVNTLLAFFNMLPIPPLDGFKVFSWNKKAWIGFFVLIFLIRQII